MKIANNKISERYTWQKGASCTTVLLTDDVKWLTVGSRPDVVSGDVSEMVDLVFWNLQTFEDDTVTVIRPLWVGYSR